MFPAFDTSCKVLGTPDSLHATYNAESIMPEIVLPRMIFFVNAFLYRYAARSTIASDTSSFGWIAPMITNAERRFLSAELDLLLLSQVRNLLNVYFMYVDMELPDASRSVFPITVDKPLS